MKYIRWYVHGRRIMHEHIYGRCNVQTPGPLAHWLEPEVAHFLTFAAAAMVKYPAFGGSLTREQSEGGCMGACLQWNVHAWCWGRACGFLLQLLLWLQ